MRIGGAVSMVAIGSAGDVWAKNFPKYIRYIDSQSCIFNTEYVQNAGVLVPNLSSF